MYGIVQQSQIQHFVQNYQVMSSKRRRSRCLEKSSSMAADLGFNVTLISDATAAHEREGYDGVLYSGDDLHKVNLVSLDGEFCTVRSTEEVLKEARRG